ncbi:MAG: LPS assembly protein LptD [Porticoccaceae bacterium]
MPPSASRTAAKLSTAIRLFVVLSLGSITLQSTAADEAANTHSEWVCQAGNDGGWACAQQSIPGPAPQRPVRATPARQLAATPPPPKDEPQVSAARGLDWVDQAALTPQQRETLEPGCCGAYVEPARNYPDAALNPNQAPMRASATTTEAEGNVATLTGDVQVSQGYRQVRGDKAVVDQNAHTAKLQGNVQFREPGLLLLGDNAIANIETKDVEVNDATYVFHQSRVRGTAKQVRRANDDIIYIDNATYTTCEPGNNTWRLAASSVKIDPATGMATARNVRVAVKGVPILYTPWLRFPVDNRRATGLLFPEIRVGSGNGVDYAQPIYLNLAPNYDATITPRYIQERGAMLAVEARHLSRQTETTVAGAYLASDNGGDNTNDTLDPVTGLRPREGDNRWLAAVDHKGVFDYIWSTRVDYTKVSDVDYFRDLGNSSLEVTSRTYLPQMAGISYGGLPNWQLYLRSQEYQTLLDGAIDQYQQLPRLDANGLYRFDNLDLILTLRNHYTRFDHRDPTAVNGVIGDRLRTDWGLTWDKQWQWGYFRPTLKAKHLSYSLDNPVTPGGDDGPSATVPVAIIDTGLYFERNTSWLKGFSQTLEPRLYYLNSDFKEQSEFPVFDTSELTFSYQQLFRDDRFAGGDRIGDGDQVTIGLTSRLLDDDGVERLRGSIGQIRYLDDRFVSVDPTLTKNFLENLTDPGLITNQLTRIRAEELLRNQSSVAAELAMRLSDLWRFQSDVLFDDAESRLDKSNLSLHYQHPDRTRFNVSYRYTRNSPLFFTNAPLSQDLKQGDISAFYPLSATWSLVGRWNHDFTNGRELEVFGGFEYESCCWRTTLLARRWLDRQNNLLLPQDSNYNTGVFLQIQLKGLGGIGNQVSGILHDGIYGYEPRER